MVVWPLGERCDLIGPVCSASNGSLEEATHKLPIYTGLPAGDVEASNQRCLHHTVLGAAESGFLADLRHRRPCSCH